MTALSTTVDTTYPDSSADASVKQHQQDHDVVHGRVNRATQVQTIASSTSALTLDLSLGTVKAVTLTANCTVNVSNAIAGEYVDIIVRLKQDATGGRTVTFSATTFTGGVKWSGGQPALSSAANALDVLVLSYDGATWLGSMQGRGFA